MPFVSLLLSVLLSMGLGAEVSPAVKKIVVIGDSLTEGYGVTREQAFPKLLQEKIHKSKEKKFRVINSGVSGSTSASGLRRLNWVLKSKPSLIIIALGANDGLRGLPVTETYTNLSQMLDKGKSEGVKILLTGMRAPPNYGEKYTNEFFAIFKKLSKEKKVPLVPFLLEGVAGNKELNQQDGIHPNPKGHKKIADLVYKYLEPLL